MKENTITAKAIHDIWGLGKLPVFPKAMLFLFFFLLSWNVGYGQIIRVSPNGTGDGSSWDDPSSLADAIDNALAEDEIWLMQGVYEIDETLDISFGQSGIGLFGGFEGTETVLNQRNWQNNTTILDGQTTVKIMRVSANNSILDGLTFTGGFITGTIAAINDGGGALRLAGDNTLVINCTFRDNVSEAERGGGAIFMWHGRGHTIDNCVFEDNSNVRSSGNGGGAIHNWDRDVTIRNTRFTNNFSTVAGGAVYTWSNNVTIEDCVFENNQSVGSGGALYTSSELTLSNSTFIENSSSRTGGAIYNGGELDLNSITFTANVANGDGGAIYNNDELSVSNSLFHRNITISIGGAIHSQVELYVTNSTFVSNTNTAIVHPHWESTSFSTYRTHIYNSIFFDNTSGTVNGDSLWPDVDRYISNQDQSEKDFRRNIFQENPNGSDNLIGIDPLFRDFANGDFSLQDNSLAVEYGRNDLYTAVKGHEPGADDDLAGNDRLYGMYVDAGAYELQEEPVEIVPNCTAITAPVDAATDVSLLPTIQWDAVLNVTGYRLTIGTTPTGGEVLDNVDVGNSTAYNFTDEGEDELEEGTMYYVTVVPYNDEGSAEGCSGISFTTETLATAPDCTTIISPSDGAIDVPVDASITWEAVPEADSYRVFISMVPDDTDIIDVGITPDTSFNLPTDFDENTTYYVRIVPSNAVGDAVGCVEISFTTEQAAMTGLSFEDGSFVYDGTEHSLVISGTLPPGASVDYTDNGRTDVGVQVVTVAVSAPDHETLTLEAELEVTPAPLAVQANSLSKTYGATDPVLTYTHDGLVDGDTEATFTGSLSREVGEEVGEYAIQQGSLSAGDNYTINYVGTIFTIVPAETVGVSFEDGRFVYDGTEHRLAISGTMPPGASVDYTDNGRTDVGVQMVTATVNAANYQEVVLEAELEIIPAQLSISADSYTKLYGSADFEWTYRAEGLIGEDMLNGALSRESGDEVGEYAILQGTLSGGANYEMNFVPGILRIYRGVDAEHIPDAPLEIYGNEQLSIQVQLQNIWTEAYEWDDEVMLRLDVGAGLDIVRVESTDVDIVQQNGMWLLRSTGTWDPSTFRHLEITLEGNEVFEGFSSLTLHVYNPQNTGAQADVSLQLDIRVEQGIEELVIPNVFTPNGDGLNDRFEIIGLRSYDYVRLLVVNQFGVGVYYHENYQNTWTGSGVLDGTYYYLVQAYRGWEKREYRGYVLIKRE